MERSSPVRAVLDMRGLIDQCVQCVASSLPRTWDACGNMGSPAILSAERLEYSTSNARQQGLSQADLMTAHAHTQGGGVACPISVMTRHYRAARVTPG